MKKYTMLLLALAACGSEKTGPEPIDPSTLPSTNIYDPEAFQLDADSSGVPSQCPGPEHPAGLNVGDTFPSVQFPNVDWEPVNIKSLCGSGAILVVAATEWCGACIVEFDYLAEVATDWRERGVEIYYTLFEDRAGQPTGPRTLMAFESYMLDVHGTVPFRVLADPTASLPRSLNQGVSLPVAWGLDEQMVIRNFSEGTSGPMVSDWVEDILARPPASPIF